MSDTSTHVWTDRTGHSYSYKPYDAEPIAETGIVRPGRLVSGALRTIPAERTLDTGEHGLLREDDLMGWVETR